MVARAKFKADKYPLDEEAHATPRRASYNGREEGRDFEADRGFAGEVEGVGFRLQKAAVIGSVKAVWKTLKSSG